jgi:hypothetical protein
MQPFDTSSALAAEAIRDRLEHARRARLATLARCCNPATWRRALGRLRSGTRRAQRRESTYAQVCCV